MTDQSIPEMVHSVYAIRRPMAPKVDGDPHCDLNSNSDSKSDLNPNPIPHRKLNKIGLLNLSKIELCSATESMTALMTDDRIGAAVD